MSRFAGSFDANVLLRLILGDVSEQRAAALMLMNRHPQRQFAVADTALYETAFVLGRNYDFTRRQVAEALSALMSLQQINCNRVMFTQALEMYVNHPALSLEDCALTVYAQLNDAVALYTFDRKLAKQADAAELVAA